MGDYVNNGPDSFGTLKLVKRLKRRGALALAGNHDDREYQKPQVSFLSYFLLP
jgi:tRNA(Ile)-lysidine synthase TilS/MesJ